MEDVGVAVECGDPLLDPGPAAVEEADDRDATAAGLVLDHGDLLGVHLAERTAERGGVLGEQGDRTAVDGDGAGHDAVTIGTLVGKAEGGHVVTCLRSELHEGAVVGERVDPAPGVGPLDGRLGVGHRFLCWLVSVSVGTG